MGDGELAPRLVDSGMEKTELKVALNGDVLCKAVGVAGGWFDENILTIKA